MFLVVALFKQEHLLPPPPKQKKNHLDLSIKSQLYRTLSFYGPDLSAHYAYAHYSVQLKKVGPTFLILLMQVVENDRLRNANREALTALRKKARTTKASVPSPFESIMKEIGGFGSKPLISEVCTTCGNHDPTEDTWMMLPGTDIFALTPFHTAHTILERGSLTYSIVGVSRFILSLIYARLTLHPTFPPLLSPCAFSVLLSLQTSSLALKRWRH